MASTNTNRVGKSTRRTQTCDMCKVRHQKCSGTQPRCNNCELRGINCSYSNLRQQISDQTGQSPESTCSPPVGMNARSPISGAEYDRLYAQIFGDIVRRLNLDGNCDPGFYGEGSGSIHSQPCKANLLSFYREVSKIIREQVLFDNRQPPSQGNGSATPAGQIREPPLERSLEHVRTILRGSLPSRDMSQRLLDMFFNYHNSVFYVCNRNEVQAQLSLMYERPEQVSMSWFCQMFLIFAVGVQFDDIDDAEGATYYEIGRKYMDDALDENPEDNLWIVRALLLVCFYQPSTKLTSIWIYLDAAIRGAHKYQLDIGYNMLKELSDEEYQEWRQLWLTIISFDRWVAIFLGRMPHIKESISRDPIFKGQNFKLGPDHCMLQNSITSLAVISGYILRDMYFSDQFRLSTCHQRRSELGTWMANLPDPLRQQVESGVVLNLSKGQTEAVVNLHFMHLGVWMLLTRPLLLKVVKMKTSANNSASPIVSAISADARVCIDYAFRLINSAATTLCVSLPPKRSFMPVFFLINAAHVMILGAAWKRLQQRGNGYTPSVNHDPSRELAAVDESTRILDICGQRNPFARKYSILIKDLRQQLGKLLPTGVGDVATPSSTATQAASLISTPYNASMAGSYESPTRSDSTPDSQGFQNLGLSVEQNQNGMPASPLPNPEMNRGYRPSVNSSNLSDAPWSEHFGIFCPTNDTSTFDSVGSYTELSFLDKMFE